MFSMRGYDFVCCEWCDLAMYRGAEQVESSEALLPLRYPDYVTDAPVRRRQARQALRWLSRAGVEASRGPHLLDVGCAAGFFMSEAARPEYGWKPQGCDVNGDVVSYARYALGLDVLRSEFLDAPFAAGSFDVITMLSVLQHLPRPRQVEQRAYALLRPGGVIAIETWNRRSLAARGMGSHWHVYAPPSCLWYHSHRSLSVLFSSDRWKPLRYVAAPKWISVRHATSAMKSAAPRLASVARRTFRVTQASRTALPYVAGDHVLAIFQRDERAAA